MLGISQNREDVTRCRYCGEKLSLLQRLSRAEYCYSGHKEAYHRDQEKMAGLQEPGVPRETEWGPVGSSRQPRPAGLPASRGIVHRDLSLQRTAAEPLLEPLICRFGSARGGLWDSRT